MSQPKIQEQQEERARIGLRASFIGLIVNGLLAASKIIAGSISGSVSILADGLNNLSDTGSVIISWLSLYLARKPEDHNHPYGHGRFEYIGSLAIAVVIVYVGIDLLKSSIQAIINPVAPLFSWWIAALTSVGIPAKIFLYLYNRNRGKAYNLSTLKAAAQDSFNDVLITSAVLIGLLLSQFAGILADGWLGILVSGFILYSGISLIKDTVTVLVGGKPDQDIGNKILDVIMRYPVIQGYHDFVLHDYGPGKTMASIHVEVDASLNLMDVHEVVDEIEQEILRTLNLPITIHMDPVLPITAPGQEVKQRITAYLEGLTPPLSMHDFRMVAGKRTTKVIFDVVVPADHHDEKLISQISAYVRTIDPSFVSFIRIDRDYFTKREEEAD